MLHCSQVLEAISHQAWMLGPGQYSHKQLATLLFCSARLAISPAQQQKSELQLHAAALGAVPGSAAEVPTPMPLLGVTDIANELILATAPEQQQQQIQQQDRLSLSDIIRVLWALCVYGSLDIAQYGWLLVAVAAGPWQRLSEEQLIVIKQGQVGVMDCLIV